MNILIINLPRHADRLAFQRTQMDRLGLSYQLSKAVDSVTLPDNVYKKLSHTWERPMRPAEVCCFLSHQAAWQSIIDSDQPALILEDDAVLAHTVPALLEALSKRQDLDLVNLEIRARKKIVGRPTQITSDLNLLPLFQDRTGTGGYVLWPSGARKLLDKASRGHAANADAFISSHYALRAFQVEPAALIQLDMCQHYGLPVPLRTTSSIGAVERPSTDRSLRLMFTGRRLMGQLRIGARILSVAHKAKRRYITLNKHHFE